MRILFVSANPRWTETLKLAEEQRTLQQSLKGHEFTLIPLPAARIEDLTDALEPTDGDEKIDIVHFCGHADGENGLYFDNVGGRKAALRPEKLREILNAKGVRLTVLNACNTLETANALIPSEPGQSVVDAVICTKQKLKDTDGILMTKVLYSELGRKAPLAKALAKAKEVICETARGQSQFAYELYPSEASQIFFEKERAPEAEHEELAKSQIDDAKQNKFNRHFYVNYLDEQIATLEKSITTNRWILGILFALVVGLLAWSPFTRDSIWNFLLWLVSLFVAESANPDSRPLLKSSGSLLESLQALGQAIPAYYAALQARWCVHGGIKLRQLKALKELLRKSDEMDSSLQARLDKIMDESVRAADVDWKPVSALIKPLLGFIYEVIGADQRSKQKATEKQEAGATS